MAKKEEWKHNCSPKQRKKRTIFLVYRDMFFGDRLKIRSFDQVHKIVNDHADETRPYIGGMKTRMTCEIILGLLKAGWFEPNSAARTYLAQFFPTRLPKPNSKIVTASRATNIEADDSEKSEEDVNDATEGHRSFEFNPEDDSELESEEASRVVIGDNETNRLQGRKYQLGTYQMPSNYTYLPYKLQHSILTSTQKLLEECCFYFSRKWLPSFLEERGWDTPEAGELTLYWKSSSPVSVPAHAMSIDQALGPLLDRIKVIRNAAVHRYQKVPLVTLEAMLNDATALASGLRDDKRAAQILRRQQKLKDLVRRLESDLAIQREVKEKEIEAIKQQKEGLYRELNALELSQVTLEQSLDAIGKSPSVIDAESLTALEEIFGITRLAEESPITGDAGNDSQHQPSISSSLTTTRKEIDFSKAVPTRPPPKHRTEPVAMITPLSMTPSRRSSDDGGSSQALGRQNAADALDFDQRPLKRRKLFCTSASPGPITRSMAKEFER